MNKVFLTGYIASDPKSRITSSGIEQSNFSIAIHDLKNFNETYFFQCVVWGQQAKFTNNNLKKGSLVSIDGRLTRRSYIDKDGKNIYIVEVVCDNIKSFSNNMNKNIDNNNMSQNIDIDKIVSIDEILNESNTNSSSDNNNESKKFDWESEL